MATPLFTNKQQARDGLEVTLASLPETTVAFEQVTSSKDVFPGVVDDRCYYGRAYFVYGASLQLTDAIDQYVAVLQQSGWALDQGTYPTSKILRRDANLINVSEPVGYWAYDDRIEEAQEQYASVIVVRVDHEPSCSYHT